MSDESIELARLLSHNSVMRHTLLHIVQITRMMADKPDAPKAVIAIEAIREMALVALREPPTADELRHRETQKDN